MIYFHTQELEEMHIQPAGEGLTDKACPPGPVGDFTGLYTAAGMNDTGLLTDGRKGELKKWHIIIFRAVKRLIFVSFSK